MHCTITCGCAPHNHNLNQTQHNQSKLHAVAVTALTQLYVHESSLMLAVDVLLQAAGAEGTYKAARGKLAAGGRYTLSTPAIQLSAQCPPANT